MFDLRHSNDRSTSTNHYRLRTIVVLLLSPLFLLPWFWLPLLPGEERVVVVGLSHTERAESLRGQFTPRVERSGAEGEGDEVDSDREPLDSIETGSEDHCCDAPDPADPHATKSTTLEEIPDTLVIDQDGQQWRFRSDLLEGKTVAISFFFTTCKTVCPPLTATFRSVQQHFEESLGDEIQLISISVDPTHDIPARLKQFSQMFNAQPGWKFLTGQKQEIDRLLLALGAATPNKFDHTPMILVGNIGSGEWRRTYGLAPASSIVEVIERIHTRAVASTPSMDAKKYFPNRLLIDQHGESGYFYEDYLKNRMVMIHVMFTRCTSICPPMLTNLSKVCELLGDRMGRDVELLSITVDPSHDTPEILLEYSKAFGAPEGWKFLTGEVEDVREVLSKLGAWVEDPENHNAWLILGNEPTGDWRKLLSNAPSTQISSVVRQMLDGGHNIQSSQSSPKSNK